VKSTAPAPHDFAIAAANLARAAAIFAAALSHPAVAPARHFGSSLFVWTQPSTFCAQPASVF
jgi:hypothetical protein